MPAIPDPTSGNRVFISCVSDEFEKPGAPFPGLRGALRHYLTRAHCEVKVQEDFHQDGAVDTVEKLDGYIRRCAAVVHLVGEKPGAIAERKAVADYLAAEPKFLEKHPELRAALGDCTDLSYTQWEALIALHHGVPLFVYATDKAKAGQQAHLDRLLIARKYAAPIKGDADLLGQLIGDIHSIIASVPKFERKLASSKILRHAPRQLFGREAWLDDIDDIWARRTGVNVYALIAWGGAGKTSVVAHWVSQRMAARGWPGVERYFDWSFYSQGAREQSQASADLFIAEALKFFGDPDPRQGGPWERGERLAGLVRRHRTLLVLDGIEPLQYPPNSPQAGEFKDEALAALLQGLAFDNPGLCLVTSRESLKALEPFHGGTAEEKKLDKLHREAALALLRHLQINGSDEDLEAAWRDAGGHALTLQLLGRFIAQAYPDRDIRHRAQVHLTEVDRQTAGRTVMKVLLAYEKWLESAGPERQRDLAVLRLMGLFDRPAGADCLAALRAAPVIPGLTDAIVPLRETEWNSALKDLEHLDLLTLSTDAPDSPSSFVIRHSSFTADAHPLVREYFAEQLKREQPSAFRAAHSRLFDHLCAATPHRPDTLAGLQPLYQAVTHGCLAGRHPEAKAKVYEDRILRGTGNDGFYSTRKLGAIGADLGAVAAFFEQPWNRLSPNLSAPDQAWLLNEAAFSLRALGRLTEAVEPMRVSVKMAEDAENWIEAARRASNLSELEVTLGRLGEAVTDGRRAIAFADHSGDAFMKLVNRTVTADALNQAGEREEAGALFAEAERLQAERQSQFPLLYSLAGFRYADLLLAPAERAAWSSFGVPPSGGPLPQPPKGGTPNGIPNDEALAACAEAERRVTQTLEWGARGYSLLSVALDHLTLARARLYRALLTGDEAGIRNLESEIRTTLARLRQATDLSHLPKALLTAALHAGVSGQAADAARFLDEAQLIAQRGPMPLYLADVHLHRARLFGKRRPESGDRKGPDSVPNADLARARALIEQHGYWRRKEELADAES